MASLCGRIIRASSRTLYMSAARCAAKDPDTLANYLDHATGLEKRELLARAAGNDDPFNMKVVKQGLGTKDSPTEVPSAFDSRLVGCVCEEDATSVSWMWLHKGAPRRCECGRWYKLTHKEPI